MSWADLDRLSVAKPRADGTQVIVARDGRTPEQIADARPLSIVVAISRVVKGRFLLAERHGGRGSVIYATTAPPPGFLVDAVSAAGGVVFDGTREHRAGSPLATTVQLDAACCDLAVQVRRRLKARSFADALDAYEREVRRKLPARDDPAAWWPAILELAALAGEHVRETRPGRWVEAPSQRVPLALELGKGEQLFPGKLAQTIVEGGAGSMRALAEIGGAPRAAPAPGGPELVPILCDRRTVPIAKLTWERLIAEQVDTDDVPVIAYVEDHGDTIRWPLRPVPVPPTAEQRTRALANLATKPTELTITDLPGGNKIVLVTGGFFAAESLLVPATMAKVRSQLGGPKLVLVGVPQRGAMMAIDGERATLDPELQHAFLMMLESEYLEATERDRISSEAILYVDKPVGRLQSNLMDARRALRASGIDPDA